MEQRTKDDLKPFYDFIIDRFNYDAIIQAIDYFSTDDTVELAGLFVKIDNKVVFKPCSNTGDEISVQLETKAYKEYLENDTLIAFAHSHPNHESLEPSQQDLNQAKFSIHEFLIFKPHNYKEFTYIGVDNDFCKKFRLVGQTVRIKL